MSVEVRRSADRFVTEAEGRVTRHSFSFDRHYDPDNVGLGFLVCHNEDLVLPGHGYPDHPHRDLEIVTWVLNGALRHSDPSGSTSLVTPGTVQRLSAGSGVVHAEVNDGDEPVHFVQMWVRPSESGLVPSYVHSPAEVGDGWTTLAGSGDAVVPIANPDASLHVVRLGTGDSALLPDSPLLHLFVARGGVELEDAGVLGTGDALRATDDGGRRVTANDETELLLWAMR
jgi:redox-sensitive bicupin YhaK (pirin superfamily)